MERKKILNAIFFETASGKQPVRDLIKEQSREDKKEIGGDIRSVQKGFPMGLPLVRKIKPDLWEIRSTLSNGIFRVFFTLVKDDMILLHAFVKKTQKTPPGEIDLAEEHLKIFRKLQRQKK